MFVSGCPERRTGRSTFVSGLGETEEERGGARQVHNVHSRISVYWPPGTCPPDSYHSLFLHSSVENPHRSALSFRFSVARSILLGVLGAFISLSDPLGAGWVQPSRSISRSPLSPRTGAKRRRHSSRSSLCSGLTPNSSVDSVSSVLCPRSKRCLDSSSYSIPTSSSCMRIVSSPHV